MSVKDAIEKMVLHTYTRPLCTVHQDYVRFELFFSLNVHTNTHTQMLIQMCAISVTIESIHKGANVYLDTLANSCDIKFPQFLHHLFFPGTLGKFVLSHSFLVYMKKDAIKSYFM